MWRREIWQKFIGVSEEPTAYIFSVETNKQWSRNK
jgi:hypothetical protein